MPLNIMLLIQIGSPEKHDPKKIILNSHIIQVNGESPLIPGVTNSVYVIMQHRSCSSGT
jgi:hypothetical protein